MTPEQARWVYDHMNEDQRERLAVALRRLTDLVRGLEPILAAWARSGVDAAENHANQRGPL